MSAKELSGSETNPDLAGRVVGVQIIKTGLKRCQPPLFLMPFSRVGYPAKNALRPKFVSAGSMYGAKMGEFFDKNLK